MATSDKNQTQSIWTADIEQWQISGLSKAAYCRLPGLRSKKFSAWKRKPQFSVSVQLTTSSGFIGIQVGDDYSFIPQNNISFVQSLLEVLR